jgi:phosphatidylglycerol---prolipoprotein diacylglyceryl transferase
MINPFLLTKLIIVYNNFNMYPIFFGFIDSYSLMMVLALVAAFVLLYLFLRYKKTSKEEMVDIVICGSFAIACGLIFAILFQNISEFVQDSSSYQWTWGMTFYGGLFGGVFGYLLIYQIFIRKHSKGDITKVLVIAPACITLAHAIGRIGCFLEGCCHGLETTEWYGIYFPSAGKTFIPTQLYESIFLFILTAFLILLAFKKSFKYTFVVYLIAYGIFRFLIEFIRGDERGAFIGIFSPSQIWSIVLLALAIPLYFLFKHLIFKDQKNGKA